MVKTRQQLDVELDALAAAAPYLKAKAATPEEFDRRLRAFVAEIKSDADAADAAHVEHRAEKIARSLSRPY